MFKKAIVLCAMSMACSGWSESPTHHYDVYIDPAFSDSQIDMIIASATAWQVATNNFIHFSGTTYPDGPDTIQVIAVADDAAVDQQCGASNAIGCEQSNGIPSKIFIPTSANDSVFAETSLHEMGHSLGLLHRPGGIMCSSLGCAIPHITCVDVEQLCEVWGVFSCDPSTMPPCILGN